MRLRIRLVAVSVAVALLTPGLGFLQIAQAATPPYEPDSNANGTLAFFDAAGNVKTSGNPADAPFADFIQATASGHPTADGKATLFGYLPKLGQVPGQFSGEQLSGAHTYPNPSAPANLANSPLPLVSMTPAEKTLVALAGDFPNVDTTSAYAGLYQLRVKTSFPNTTAVTYEDASVFLQGCTFTITGATCGPTATWTQVYPTVVAQNTTTSLAVSPNSPVNSGTTVFLTATVTPSNAVGSVQFKDGSTSIGSAVAVSGGTASTSTNTLSVGGSPHSLTAVFTPTDPGSFTASTSTAVPYTVVTPSPVVINTTTLPHGTQNNNTYSSTLSASGGVQPYTWSLSVGSLPAGLALAPSTGVISGTPTTAGTTNFTVKVTDATSPTAQTATQALSIVVDPPPPVVINTTTLPHGTQNNNSYSSTLSASGGTPPYTWSLSVGSLPAGLALAPSTGVISGTPTTAGTTNFTVKVTDATSPTAQTATQALSIVVDPPPPVAINTTTVPGGTAGTAYTTTVAASGGTQPYAWSLVVVGTLPPGLNLAAATGIISGTPTTVGTFNFTVMVTDSTTPTAQTATQALSIVIAPPTPVAIGTTSVPAGTVGTAYSTTLAASGGITPYTWSETGTLPGGLSLNASTGAISGTPTAAGTSNITVTVTDSLLPSHGTATQPLAIVIQNPPPLTISTTSLPNAVVSTAYSTTLVATGGITPYTWSVSAGSLPTGLTLDSTGVISGTPTTAGEVANFTVKATDVSSPAVQVATQGLTITVTRSISPVSVFTTSLPNGAVGTLYSATLAAVGGTTPYTWSVSAGTLPGGLSLNATTGVISGTPTGGSANFTVMVTDATSPTPKTATRDLSILVGPPGSVGAGYWLVATDGGIFNYGKTTFYGSTGAIHLNRPIVGMAPTADRKGYWLAASDGGIFGFGDATFFGSTGAIHLNKPIVGMAPTPTGLGYWLVASDGGIFGFGDAGFFGSAGSIHLNQPIVGMAPTPTGKGYWLVASDGGIFGYGDAGAFGSAGSIRLNKPIVGMAPTPTGKGYWLVASDGGIFGYGDAGSFGSTGAMHLNKPVVGMAATPSGNGYWLVASDGGIFGFGDAGSFGSAGSIHLNNPVVGMAGG